MRCRQVSLSWPEGRLAQPYPPSAAHVVPLSEDEVLEDLPSSGASAYSDRDADADWPPRQEVYLEVGDGVEIGRAKEAISMSSSTRAAAIAAQTPMRFMPIAPFYGRVRDTPFQFGMYKGKSVEEVTGNHPSYFSLDGNSTLQAPL